MNISGLDHIVILAQDGEKAARDYALILGRDPDWRHATPDDGTITTLFCLSNTNVEVLAPHGNGPVGDRIREILGSKTGLLSSLALRVSDIESAHHTSYRRGLNPDDIIRMQVSNGETVREWSRFRADDRMLSGLKVFFIEEHASPMIVRSATPDGANALDHLVVMTHNPDRALASYGARLGFPLVLDRTSEEWKARFLFFRLPNTVFEVVQRLDNTASDTVIPDTMNGVCWRVEDIQAARDRLVAAGVDVSEIRKGRKPGTTVMTIKSHTMDVPTLLLSEES